MYLKILDILYLLEETNTPINSSVVKTIIKLTHIFNDIKVASKSHVVKVSSKVDITIIWINIWDSQSSLSAKTLINKCFNVRSFIATIHSANMNPDVLQCKNCWKWGYTTFACCFQGSQYIKYNRLHKVEHHHHLTWCCKVKFKMNTSHLKTKQGKSCPHSFKYLNCKGNYKV